MKNIVFIGLPGCGKTTVSRLVAETLKCPWFDSDYEIQAAEHLTIPEIFDTKGEGYFRESETACVERLMAHGGAVVALGGGAVLRNGALIAKNSIVVYLRRSAENILATLPPGTRPLLADPGALHALYEQRHRLYEQLCDITIENDSDAQTAANRAVKAVREAWSE